MDGIISFKPRTESFGIDFERQKRIKNIVFNTKVENPFVVPPGMSTSIWQDKYSRKKEDGSFQTWEERLREVVYGNFLLSPKHADVTNIEIETTTRLALKGIIPFSGRHLQHGDEMQPTKQMELFTNCFDGSTKIITLEHGPIEFRKIVGETVTVKSADGVWRPAKVSAYGKQKVYKYTFGAKTANKTKTYEIAANATANHKWFLDDGEETAELDVGDVIAIAPTIEEEDNEAIMHGLVFGDGSGHKRNKHARRVETQGRQYCSIRLCGDDKEKYSHIFEGAGYTVKTPDWANGDGVVYIGTKNWKDLPFTTDPSYIAGFIKGWWYADGAKGLEESRSFLEISTTNEQAVDWLKLHAAYAGYIICGVSVRERNIDDGSYANGKPLLTVRLTKSSPRKVLSKEFLGIRNVYCVTEPVTGGFVLANGLLTGNCSTAIFNFINFWLLLNGSGVGSDYSCYTRRVNYCKYMPHVRLVLDGGIYDDGKIENGAHPDFAKAQNEFSGFFETKREATHKYPADSEDVRWFNVEDSREGWVKIIEVLETAAFQEKHADKLFIFDLSGVRAAGAPIAGQQNRPASGPLPLMRALCKVINLKGVPGMLPWKQSLFIDHYLAACVALGGVRRSARMATKYWRDPDVFEFIEIKRGGFLHTANISVLVDKEFWKDCKDPRSHAWRVFQAMTAAQYFDMTGEPGFLNMDSMNTDRSGIESITADNYINPNSKLKVHDRTKEMMGNVLSFIKKMPIPFIVNPCAEIVLALYGAYCVISDVCLANCDTLEEAIEAVRAAGPCLVRVNQMESLYETEVKRTNRIGVCITGIHEFAAKHFGGINFYDMVNAYNPVSASSRFDNLSQAQIAVNRLNARKFWTFIGELEEHVVEATNAYCDRLGINRPHTYTAIKPSGTISKVLLCTEGAHLPAVDYYMRWVQLPKMVGHDPNPVVQDHENRGYPVKDISHQYTNAVVVGYPTRQPIAEILGDRTVCADETTPYEQFEFLRLIEEFWFGVNEDGSPRNNQCSITLKYNPSKVSYPEYMDLILNNMSTIRACAIMPVMDMSAYAYQPEEKITIEAYKAAVSRIETYSAEHAEMQTKLKELYDNDALNCAGGACGVDENVN